MGRKANYAAKPKKGPGRQAKIQAPPTPISDTDNRKTISQRLLNESNDELRNKEKSQNATSASKNAEVSAERLPGFHFVNGNKKKIIKAPQAVSSIRPPKKIKKAISKNQSDDDNFVTDEEEEVSRNGKNNALAKRKKPAVLLSNKVKPTKVKRKKAFEKVEEESPEEQSDDDQWMKDDFSDDDEEKDDSDLNDDDEVSNDDLASSEKMNESDDEKWNEKSNDDDDDDEGELMLNIGETEKFILPSGQQIEKEKQVPPDLQIIGQRIKDLCHVLANFSERRQEDRSRQEYLDLLATDLCEYYGYNRFLMQAFMDLFSIAELMEFLEANEVPRPMTLRTNTLKTRRGDLARLLISRGVNLDPIKWSPVGLVVYNSNVPVGATPEYLAGHYMLQGAASFLPVMALAPQEGEKILDMCAAPGGKTTHIAALMKNTGVLFANDSSTDRCKAIIGNVHRLGATNVIVTNYDARFYNKYVSNFNRVLLDAPCTGTGVLSKDQHAKLAKDEMDVRKCSQMQRDLLLTAIDSVEVSTENSGYIVYSTCSVLPQENEVVIDYVLKRRQVVLVETGLNFGAPAFKRFRQYRFDPSMEKARRFYPHTHNTEGFFVAKLKKLADGPRKAQGNDSRYEDTVKKASDDKPQIFNKRTLRRLKLREKFKKAEQKEKPAAVAAAVTINGKELDAQKRKHEDSQNGKSSKQKKKKTNKIQSNDSDDDDIDGDGDEDFADWSTMVNTPIGPMKGNNNNNRSGKAAIIPKKKKSSNFVEKKTKKSPKQKDLSGFDSDEQMSVDNSIIRRQKTPKEDRMMMKKKASSIGLEKKKKVVKSNKYSTGRTPRSFQN